MFLKRSALLLLSVQTLTFTLPSSDGAPLLPQNQVAIVAVCEVASSSARIIIATTHLKASKTAEGEAVREREMQQLLDTCLKVRDEVQRETSWRPAVLITGDLNALPAATKYYAPLTYALVKAHPLLLRSVYNDDALSLASESAVANEGLWTTWKARRGRDEQDTDKVVKHCIDYILYSPGDGSPHQSFLQPTGFLDLLSSEQVGDELLPSRSYPSDHLAIAAVFAVKSS